MEDNLATEVGSRVLNHGGTRHGVYSPCLQQPAPIICLHPQLKRIVAEHHVQNNPVNIELQLTKKRNKLQHL